MSLSRHASVGMMGRLMDWFRGARTRAPSGFPALFRVRDASGNLVERVLLRGVFQPSGRRIEVTQPYRIWSMHGDVAAEGGTIGARTQRQRWERVGGSGGTTSRPKPRHRSSTRRVSVTQTPKRLSPRRVERAHPLFPGGTLQRQSARPSERTDWVPG